VEFEATVELIALALRNWQRLGRLDRGWVQSPRRLAHQRDRHFTDDANTRRRADPPFRLTGRGLIGVGRRSGLRQRTLPDTTRLFHDRGPALENHAWRVHDREKPERGGFSSDGLRTEVEEWKATHTAGERTAKMSSSWSTSAAQANTALRASAVEDG